MESCVIRSAAELHVFDRLRKGETTAETLARNIGADPEALGVLLDALTGLELLDKRGDRYANRESGPPSVVPDDPDYRGSPRCDDRTRASWSRNTGSSGG